MMATDEYTDADALADLKANAPEAAISYSEAFLDPNDGAAKAKGKGKGKGSKWNAVRHGCMAKLLLPADLAAEAARCTAMLNERYRPTTSFEVDQVVKMGRLAAQLERNQQMKAVDVQRCMDRAVLCWDDDREIYVDSLVLKLGTVPGVARALARSKQGAFWLLERWAELEEILQTDGTWDDDQCRLALDLRDVLPAIRKSNRTIVAGADAAVLAEVVQEEVERLENRLKAYLLATDDGDRSMAAAGTPMEEDADTKRLRKQEAKLKLDYRRAKQELLDSRAETAAATADPAPAPAAAKPAPRAPVVSSVYVDPDTELDPRPRPKTSNAAYKYALQRAKLNGLEIPATATSAARTIEIKLPFSGGDAESEPESEPDSEPQPEAAAKPAGIAKPVTVVPEAACVASRPLRGAGAKPQPDRDRDRKARRNQEKKARKAARRRRR